VHHFGLPHAAQVVQVTRKTHDLSTRRWRAVTLTHAQSGPGRLADRPRRHWVIENGLLHYIRVTTFAEDAFQRRTGTGPQVIACGRATSLSVCSAGPGRSTSPPPSATTPATPITPRRTRRHPALGVTHR
jgi:predicted transposase YbfD/YdcC